MFNRIFLNLGILVIVATVFAAEPSPVNPAAVQKRDVKIMKTSNAWIAMTNQLAQYDDHYIDATDSIAEVTDAKTRTALTKSLKATDDCHDALVKLIKCFTDYVKANE